MRLVLLKIWMTLFALALQASGALAQNASISFWSFQDQRLRLEARGDERAFLYEKLPTTAAAAAGISAGATFWQGQRRGSRLEGEAFVYKAGCQPMTYKLGGAANLADRKLVLEGMRPVFAASGCQAAGEAKARLVLRLLKQPRSIRDAE
jgi:hypothetical protein